MNFRRGKRGRPAALQMTALMDVVFLLLCFFVTTSVFALAGAVAFGPKNLDPLAFTVTLPAEMTNVPSKLEFDLVGVQAASETFSTVPLQVPSANAGCVDVSSFRTAPDSSWTVTAEGILAASASSTTTVWPAAIVTFPLVGRLSSPQ